MAAKNVPVAGTGTAQIRELSRAEGWQLLEAEAQHYLQMTAQQFMEDWRAGAFGDPDSRPEVLSVAMLLPFVGEDPRSDREGSEGAS